MTRLVIQNKWSRKAGKGDCNQNAYIYMDIYIYLSNILIYDMHIYNVYNTEKNDDDDDDDGNEKLY